MQIGDRVRECNRASSAPEGTEGTIIELPGMEVYDSISYTCAEDGCVWESDDGGRHWSFRKHLQIILPAKSNWEV